MKHLKEYENWSERQKERASVDMAFELDGDIWVDCEMAADMLDPLDYDSMELCPADETKCLFVGGEFPYEVEPYLASPSGVLSTTRRAM